jgi:putative transcriptional regulator
MVLIPYVVFKFNSTLKEHREKKGFTQEGLARQLGVSRQTIVNIEKGLNEPRVLLAIAIAGLLGVAVIDLFHEKS